MSDTPPPDKDSFTSSDPNAWKPWLIASAAATILLLVSLGLMKLLGLLDVPRDDPGTKTLAAALALVGSVLTVAVTLIGTVVKYSIDDRTARLAATEAKRNYALAVEAEKRNRIDAAIRAVGLLSDNNENATTSQIGGAILALVSLGELELAVGLLAQPWPDGLASPYVADVVLTTALREGPSAVKNSAATVLFLNAERLRQTGFHFWPIPGLGWNSDLSVGCRVSLVKAAAYWMKDEIRVEDPNYKDRLPNAVLVLHKALSDPDPIVASFAAASLRPFLDAFPDSMWGYVGDGTLQFSQIARQLDGVTERVKRMSEIGDAAHIGEQIKEAVEERLERASATVVGFSQD